MTLMELIEQRRRLSAVVLASLAQSEPDCMYCGEDCPWRGEHSRVAWTRAPIDEVLPSYETFSASYERERVTITLPSWSELS